jgi:RNA polymerase sigma factor (TIGR02999 family)
MFPMSARSDDLGFDLLVEALYTDLRRIAQRERRTRAQPSETLRTTALINEAYMKLSRHGAFRDRGHFLATASLAMRQVVVNHARTRLTEKRGAGEQNLPLEAADAVLAESEERIVAIDEALARLESVNPRCARVVECRYFAGLSEAETALALGVTERTVQRDWAKSKALLYEMLDASV